MMIRVMRICQCILQVLKNESWWFLFFGATLLWFTAQLVQCNRIVQEIVGNLPFQVTHNTGCSSFTNNQPDILFYHMFFSWSKNNMQQGMVESSASKPALRQDTCYMVEKTYSDIAPYLGAFGSYVMPQ